VTVIYRHVVDTVIANNIINLVSFDAQGSLHVVVYQNISKLH